MRSLKAAGKFVECYLDTVGEGGNGTLDYLLASACDHIQMSPAGEPQPARPLPRHPVPPRHLRQAEDRSRLQPRRRVQERRRDLHREPVHPGRRPRPLNGVLDSLYGQIVAAVAESRRLKPEAVRALIDGAPYTAEEAKAKGLIDRLGYPDEFRDRIRRLAGGRPRLVRLESYGKGSGVTGQRVAVVFAEGEIHRGGGPGGAVLERSARSARTTWRRPSRPGGRRRRRFRRWCCGSTARAARRSPPT